MAKRRRIRGKKLLIVSASLGAASFLACGDDDRGGPIANLLPPPDSGPSDAAMDAPVANLLPPPDSGFDASSMEDAAADDADQASDADTVFLDAPIANLLPPPDGSF